MHNLHKQIDEMGNHAGDEDFGAAFIHQMIETIEFVLGTVSNTASYLRLWALSLAHGQLAQVFFNLTFNNPVSKGMKIFPKTGFFSTVILSFFAWPALWAVTFAVLMCMDCLECILHCLRLHWVEF